MFCDQEELGSEYINWQETAIQPEKSTLTPILTVAFKVAENRVQRSHGCFHGDSLHIGIRQELCAEHELASLEVIFPVAWRDRSQENLAVILLMN